MSVRMFAIALEYPNDYKVGVFKFYTPYFYSVTQFYDNDYIIQSFIKKFGSDFNVNLISFKVDTFLNKDKLKFTELFHSYLQNPNFEINH